MHSACTSYTMTSSAATGRKMIVLPTTAVLVLFLLIPRLMRCPSTGRAVTKPLYLLTLVPFTQDNGGWDRGLGVIAGSRVAQDEINNRTDLLPGYHIELIVVWLQLVQC